MTTNSTIQNALDGILIAASLGYPIAWPGQDFTPPDSGYWLEVTFLPNRGYDNGVNGNSTLIPQGLYQIAVASRPVPEIQIRNVTDTVMAEYVKGSTVVDSIQISRHPYTGTMQSEQDRVRINITIEYSG